MICDLCIWILLGRKIRRIQQLLTKPLQIWVVEPMLCPAEVLLPLQLVVTNRTEIASIQIDFWEITTIQISYNAPFKGICEIGNLVSAIWICAFVPAQSCAFVSVHLYQHRSQITDFLRRGPLQITQVILWSPKNRDG